MSFRPVPKERVVDAEILATQSSSLSRRTLYVYELPLRLWHWITALAVLVLCVTGYFIGSPPPTQPGEAYAGFLMGHIRFFHFASGYVLAIALLGRVYWAFVGNAYARELFVLPVWSGEYWRGIWSMVKWYGLVSPRPNRYVGHNPLARTAMFFMFFLGSVFMIFTGFALYSQGAQAGSWPDRLFGWVVPLFGQGQDVHTWHHMGMWVLVCFVTVHVYATVREDIMGRQSVISSMISGYRILKD